MEAVVGAVSTSLPPCSLGHPALYFSLWAAAVQAKAREVVVGGRGRGQRSRRVGGASRGRPLRVPARCPTRRSQQPHLLKNLAQGAAIPALRPGEGSVEKGNNCAETSVQSGRARV